MIFWSGCLFGGAICNQVRGNKTESQAIPEYYHSHPSLPRRRRCRNVIVKE
jgi:hypothetical protein